VLFERYSQVGTVKLINDRETGRQRGFGFVDMPSAEAQAVIAALNHYDMDGGNPRIDEALERAPRPPRSGGCRG